jgi:F-type H+-transporting ATPase subunit b
MMVAKFLNFFILFSGITYLVRKPLKEFVFTRHTTLREELETTRAMLAAAQKKFQEFSNRLHAMDSEIETLVRESREEAQGSKVRILTEAKKMSDTILIDSKKASETMLLEFKKQIKTEFAGQVLARAETILKSKLTGDDRVRLVKDFSKQVGASK